VKRAILNRSQASAKPALAGGPENATGLSFGGAA